MLLLSNQKNAPRIVGFVAALAGRLASGRLRSLDLPRALQGSPIVAAFGPPGAALYDLLDGPVLNELQRGADAGVVGFRACGEWAAVGVNSRDASADLALLWPVIERLADLH